MFCKSTQIRYNLVKSVLINPTASSTAAHSIMKTEAIFGRKALIHECRAMLEAIPLQLCILRCCRLRPQSLGFHTEHHKNFQTCLYNRGPDNVGHFVHSK